MRRDVFNPQLGIFESRDVLVEDEWRDDLAAAEGLDDEEREAAARTLRRMGDEPEVFPGMTLRDVKAANKRLAGAFNSFGRAAGKMARQMANQVVWGHIAGTRHDLVIIDDVVDGSNPATWPTRWPSDRLDAIRHVWSCPRGEFHCHIHPENLKRLVPADPVFPPKVEGETVVPQLGRVCVDPWDLHVGEPRWLVPHAAPAPLDLLPEPGTPGGHPRKAAKPALRRVLARSARGRRRKQRR